jgi:cytochrome b6-f complex iron-sulfur subunit
MAEKKKLSVQEMLALARKQGAVGGGGASESPPPAEEAKAESAPTEPVAAAPAAEEAPAAEAAPASVAEKKPAAAKPAAGGKLSVAEMLAAARAQGAQKPAGAAPAAAAPKPPVEKKEPAAKPAAAAEKKEKPSAPVVGGAKDTASILAAARKTAKPGPITKAEAAAKEKPEPEAKAPTKGVVPPMPVKPDYAKPKPAKAAPEGESRRGFVGLMLGSMLSVGYTAMAATAGLWTLGFARFMFPNILTEPPSKFKVGFPSDFAPGKVEEKFKAQFGVWIVNTEYNGTPEIFALRTVCTHLGCTPNWLEAEQKFKCPCHGSGFYKDGINFEGPAPRPLERYAISLADDGQLEVDKSKLFFEETGQWVDPQSYVPV